MASTTLSSVAAGLNIVEAEAERVADSAKGTPLRDAVRIYLRDTEKYKSDKTFVAYSHVSILRRGFIDLGRDV